MLELTKVESQIWSAKTASCKRVPPAFQAHPCACRLDLSRFRGRKKRAAILAGRHPESGFQGVPESGFHDDFRGVSRWRQGQMTTLIFSAPVLSQNGAKEFSNGAPHAQTQFLMKSTRL